jgi:dTDP-glucose 4,6-dehydratase
MKDVIFPICGDSAPTVLVTGGEGFIGGCLVRQLLAEKSTLPIASLDKLTHADSLNSIQVALAYPRHWPVQGDICNATLVTHALRDFRPTAVVHLPLRKSVPILLAQV